MATAWHMAESDLILMLVLTGDLELTAVESELTEPVITEPVFTELDTAESELTAESEGHTAPTIKMLTDRITDTIKATTITRVSTKSSAIKVTTQDPVDITLETLDMLMEVLEALLHINSVDSQVHYVAHHQD
jgi:hypothetical protein